MLRLKAIFPFFIMLPIVASVLLTACNSDNEEDEATNKIDSTLLKDPTIVKINNRLFSIPSPFQVALLVKDNKVPYNKELLNLVQNQNNYSTTFKQALNLGIYGADLSYLNIYEQLPDAAGYFAVIKVLSKELGILSTLDDKTLKRIEDNSNNKDSLLYILSTIYRDADAYLFNNNRNEVGLLILAGGWVESMYIMTQTLKKYNNQEIINRIGEQKYPLNNLIELKRPYYGKVSNEFDAFLEELVELATVFDGVVIEYTYEAPTVDEEKKLTIVNSKSKTIINDYQLQKITELVEKMRKQIVD